MKILLVQTKPPWSFLCGGGQDGAAAQLPNSLEAQNYVGAVHAAETGVASRSRQGASSKSSSYRTALERFERQKDEAFGPAQLPHGYRNRHRRLCRPQTKSTYFLPVKPGLHVQLAPQLSLTHLPPLRQVKFFPHCSGGKGHLGSEKQPLEQPLLGKVEVYLGSAETGLARAVSTVRGVSRQEFGQVEKEIGTEVIRDISV